MINLLLSPDNTISSSLLLWPLWSNILSKVFIILYDENARLVFWLTAMIPDSRSYEIQNRSRGWDVTAAWFLVSNNYCFRPHRTLFGSILCIAFYRGHAGARAIKPLASNRLSDGPGIQTRLSVAAYTGEEMRGWRQKRYLDGQLRADWGPSEGSEAVSHRSLADVTWSAHSFMREC